MILPLFATKLTQSKQDKIIQVAYNLKINPNWLTGVMYFETARTLNPAIKNSIGSVGLIQFTRDKSGVNYKTIGGKQYLLDDLAKMTFEQQMNVVELYYKEVFKMLKIEKVNSFVDLYLCTFFPVAVGKPDNYVFETSGLSASKIASQNPVFDKDKNQKIQKYEVVKHFEAYYKEVFKDIDSSDLSTLSKICSYCKQVLPIIIPLTIFFYTIVTVTI